MKHNIKKAISLMLALLMAVTLFPTAIFANGSGSLTEGLTALLEMTTLDATTKTAGTATVTQFNAQGTSCNTTSGELTMGTTANGWTGYGVKTDLPLNASSKYVIEYEAKINNLTTNANRFASMQIVYLDGFKYSQSVNTVGNDTVNAMYYNQDNLYYAADGTTTNVKTTELEPPVSIWSAGAYTKFHMVINGMLVTFYVNGTNVATFDFSNSATTGPETYGTDVLCLFFRLQKHTNGTDIAAGENYASVRNIKVYESQEEVPEVPEGTKLLAMSTLDATTKTAGDATVTQFNAQITSCDTTTGELTGTGTNGWAGYGVETNLPLSASSKYTIEYEVKINNLTTNAKRFAGMMISYSGGYDNSQSIITVGNGEIRTLYHGHTKAYKTPDGAVSVACDNLWTEGEYTKFHIEINGMLVTMYVNGKKAATYDFSSNNYASAPTTWKTSQLGLFFKMQKDGGDDIALNENYASVRNIAVYQGNIMSKRTVTFLGLDGADLGNAPEQTDNLYDSGEIITAFPTVNASSADKQIIWKVADTNVMVLAPYTVTGNVTIRAYEVDKNEVIFLGTQNNTVKDEKVTLRFIGGIYDLDGDEVGFEITADGKSWTRTSSAVYNSIIVTNDDETTTTTTATELGARYLFALTLSNVPAASTDNITFTVKAFKSVGGSKIYCGTETVTVIGGTIQS